MELKYRYQNKGTRNFVDYSNKVFLSNKSLKAVIVDNGAILPQKYCEGLAFGLGGVIDKTGMFITASANPAIGIQPRFGGSYPYSNLIKSPIEEVIYLGPLTKHWGHFLVDMISRCWYILDYPNIKDLKIAYCGFNMKKDDLDGNFLRFFELLGLDKKQFIDIRIPTYFKKIIVPEAAYIPGDFYTDDYNNIFKKIIQNTPKSDLGKNEIVFFTREEFRSSHHREIGEKMIRDFFIANGCKVYAPEKLILDDQINLWNNAQSIIALSGTIPHNSLFIKGAVSSTNKLIILNKTSIINEHQIIINKIKTINPTYIDVYYEPFKKFPVNAGLGPFWMGITTPLKSFANDYGYVVRKERDLRKENVYNFIIYIFLIVLYFLKLPIRFFFRTNIGAGLKKIIKRILNSEK